MLTKAQRRILENASCVREEYEGRLCVFGPSIRAADKLVDLGYMEFVGWGPMEDDEYEDRERRMYRLTPKGKEVLKQND